MSPKRGPICGRTCSEHRDGIDFKCGREVWKGCIELKYGVRGGGLGDEAKREEGLSDIVSHSI